MYRKADLVAVGGFNPKLPGAEDSELNSRLTKKGKLLFVPNAVVLHNHGRGLKDFAKQMLRYGRDRGVARKFSLAVVPSVVSFYCWCSNFYSLDFVKCDSTIFGNHYFNWDHICIPKEEFKVCFIDTLDLCD